MNQELIKLTQDVLNCRRCLTDPTTYVGGTCALSASWSSPRGWAGLHASQHDIALVALNPGAPFPGEVATHHHLRLSQNETDVTVAQALGVEDFCMRQYRQPKRGASWVFHRKSAALARALLWLVDGKDPGVGAIDRCWFTDAFKCSTRRESAPEITSAAFDACRPHLERELSIVKPRLVVALGKRAHTRLQRAGVNAVYFRHPSNGCPRLGHDSHDSSFERAASILAVSLPKDFGRARQLAYEEAMAM